MNDDDRPGTESHFDYSAPAELYMLNARGARGRATRYRRFQSAAEAIRFAVEEISGQLLVGAVMQIDDERFDHKALRALYAQDAYPLARA
jgi:hypothetical protein